MRTVSALWRHPIKSHGREALESVSLTTGQTFPLDRQWAVTHQKSKFDPRDPQWAQCANFVRGSVTPGCAGIWAQYDNDIGEMHLRHTDLGDVSFFPDDPIDQVKFLNWIAPLTAAQSQKPVALVRTPGGMTDTPEPSISIMNMSSHRSVAGRLGRALETERWRGNIWYEGGDPWEEFDWIDRSIQIGTAKLKVFARIVRCNHTRANPMTGLRDTDTLSILRDSWDHQDFGIYAEVIEGGDIEIGSAFKVI